MKISMMLSPSMVERLDRYARQARWSRSSAAAALIEAGLEQEQDEETPE